MVRKSAMRVLVVMVLLFTGAGCSLLEDDSGDLPDLVVAATLELTGLNGDVGIAHQRALNLKAEQINDSGVLGKRRLRVVVQDNTSNPGVAVRQITDFAADRTVSAIVVGACNECSVEGAKVANERKVPLISLATASKITASNPTGPAVDRNFVFKIGPNGADGARELITEMAPADPGTAPTKVGVLFPDDLYGTESIAITNAVAKNSRVTVINDNGVVREGGVGQFQANGSNLREQVGSLLTDKPADKRPDAFLVWAPPKQAGLAADALKAAGFTGRVFYDSVAAGSLFLPNTATEGATVAFPQTLAMDDVIATSPAKAARKQWFEDYTARYGAYHGQASFAADALAVVADAVNRVGTDRSALQTAIESSETDGLSGPIRMTSLNHSGLMPQALEVFRAQGGRWRLLG